MALSIVLAATFAGLIIAFVHWTDIPGRLFGQELKPPFTYVVGVALLGLTFSAWAALTSPTWQQTVVAFWAIAAGGGAFDSFSYGIKWLGGQLTELRVRRHDD